MQGGWVHLGEDYRSPGIINKYLSMNWDERLWGEVCNITHSSRIIWPVLISEEAASLTRVVVNKFNRPIWE